MRGAFMNNSLPDPSEALPGFCKTRPPLGDELARTRAIPPPDAGIGIWDQFVLAVLPVNEPVSVPKS